MKAMLKTNGEILLYETSENKEILEDQNADYEFHKFQKW